MVKKVKKKMKTKVMPPAQMASSKADKVDKEEEKKLFEIVFTL